MLALLNLLPVHLSSLSSRGAHGNGESNLEFILRRKELRNIYERRDYEAVAGE